VFCPVCSRSSLSQLNCIWGRKTSVDSEISIVDFLGVECRKYRERESKKKRISSAHQDCPEEYASSGYQLDAKRLTAIRTIAKLKMYGNEFSGAMEFCPVCMLRQALSGGVCEEFCNSSVPMFALPVAALGQQTAENQFIPEADVIKASACDNKGMAKLKNGDQEGALAEVNEAIKLNPRDIDAYKMRGLVKFQKGDLDGAAADFNRAIKLNPRDAEAYNNQGDVKFRKGDLDGAIADFNQAIHLNARNSFAYTNRGNVKREKADFDGAIADLDRAIGLGSQTIDTSVPTIENHSDTNKISFEFIAGENIDQKVTAFLDRSENNRFKVTQGSSFATMSRAAFPGNATLDRSAT
jgi:Tfp pilus assembly protein PilF